MPSPKITIARKLGVEALLKRVQQVTKNAVYVGVPADKSSRKGGGINNAELLFIFSKGSPMHKQPPRSVLEPAIDADGNRQAIVAELSASCRAELAGDKPGARKGMKRAALAGQNAARGWFTDPRNHWAPLVDSTKNARLRRMKGKTKKAALAEIAQGGNPFTVGIDTGAMRASIIGIVKESE